MVQNTAQSLRHHNFATIRQRIMRFPANCSEKNCLHEKTSVQIKQLNMLCFAKKNINHYIFKAS